MLSVANKPFMLSVTMLSVVILSVVAPRRLWLQSVWLTEVEINTKKASTELNTKLSNNSTFYSQHFNFFITYEWSQISYSVTIH